MSVSDFAVDQFVRLYGCAQRFGLMEHPWFQAVFVRAYFLYKRYVEDSFYNLTKAHPEIFQGGHVLDIGSNVGYTALTFSRQLDPGKKVFSFEPDQKNFDLQASVIARYGVAAKIDAHQLAVGESSGVVTLWQNNAHHADHRIVTDTFRQKIAQGSQVHQVSMVNIDEFLEREDISEKIAFVKIDVQGFELAVCKGMDHTLAANPKLVLALEFMPESMRELGFNPEELVAFLDEREFRFFLFSKRGKLARLHKSEFNSHLVARGYFDFLASKFDLLA